MLCRRWFTAAGLPTMFWPLRRGGNDSDVASAKRHLAAGAAEPQCIVGGRCSFIDCDSRWPSCYRPRSSLETHLRSVDRTRLYVMARRCCGTPSWPIKTTTESQVLLEIKGQGSGHLSHRPDAALGGRMDPLGFPGMGILDSRCRSRAVNLACRESVGDCLCLALHHEKSRQQIVSPNRSQRRGSLMKRDIATRVFRRLRPTSYSSRYLP